MAFDNPLSLAYRIGPLMKTPRSASELAKEMRVHPNRIYFAIKRLRRLGIVVHETPGEKRHWLLSKPVRLFKIQGELPWGDEAPTVLPLARKRKRFRRMRDPFCWDVRCWHRNRLRPLAMKALRRLSATWNDKGRPDDDVEGKKADSILRRVYSRANERNGCGPLGHLRFDEKFEYALLEIGDERERGLRIPYYRDRVGLLAHPKDYEDRLLRMAAAERAEEEALLASITRSPEDALAAAPF